MSEHETITTKDFDDDFINDTIFLDGKEIQFLCEYDATEIEMPCPKCDSHPIVGNKLFHMDDGRYLYIGLCCGEFVICEVKGEDNGLGTE